MIEYRPDPGADIPEVDLLEQQIGIDLDDPATDDRPGDEIGPAADTPIATADEGDRVEQGQLVPGDDEDYGHDG